MKVVFMDKFLRNVSDIDAEIFGAVQWSLEVKVTNDKSDIFGALAREDTVDYKFENINQ